MTDNDTLFILGDVVDRHPAGISILEQIMDRPNIRMILGNHEHMMLSAIDPHYSFFSALKFQEMEALRRWYRNGGMVTHEAVQKAGAKKRERIFEYLRNLPLEIDSSSEKIIMSAVMELFDRIVDPTLLIRRMYIVANHVIDEREATQTETFEQMDLFTDYAAAGKKKAEEAARLEKERSRQEAILDIKKKFGKNAIVKGMDLEEGATTISRNEQVGGHKA